MDKIAWVAIVDLKPFPGNPRRHPEAQIADNRLPEPAVWDFDLLRGHFTELIEVDFDVELTGFSDRGNRPAAGRQARAGDRRSRR